MSNFIKYFLQYRQFFSKVVFFDRDIKILQDLVFDALKIANLNQLRDKHEGVAYYDKFVMRALPFLALEKKLNISLINWRTISCKEIPEFFEYNSQIIYIYSFGNELPLVNIDRTYPAIFFHVPNYKEVYICGFTTTNIITSNTVDIIQYGFGSNVELKGKFMGFDKLTKIEDLQEYISKFN